MKIQTYDDTTVELIRSTEHPAVLVGLAMSLTMRSDPAKDIPHISSEKCKFLIDAEHMSLFEHVNYTFLVTGMSRSLLAQITRQRTASPTSGSQHYQDYSDYPVTVHPLAQSLEKAIMQDTFNYIFNSYTTLIQHSIPKEEARQVLPNAACVNYLWTIDARNLFYFLRQRLCYRNVYEMRLFATRVRKLVMLDFPELFEHAGPQCFEGTCKQGKLQCTVGPWRPTQS